MFCILRSAHKPSNQIKWLTETRLRRRVTGIQIADLYAFSGRRTYNTRHAESIASRVERALAMVHGFALSKPKMSRYNLTLVAAVTVVAAVTLAIQQWWPRAISGMRFAYVGGAILIISIWWNQHTNE